MNDCAMPTPKKPVTPGMAALGARIKTAREMTGLTQRQLGDKFGVQSLQVSRWEIGSNGMKRPRLEALAKMAGVSVAWLMAGEQPAGPPASADGSPATRAYPSLDRFVANHEVTPTDEEWQWLTSQKFPARLGDIGDDEWWAGQLFRFRSLVGRRAPKPDRPTPPAASAARTKTAQRKPAR
jgi:transcriptional regulator with XRE-family HTH domain